MKKLNKLGIGTAQFGLNYGISNTSGMVSEAEVRSILLRANHLYIDTLDTAINYGESENVLGRIGVSAFNVITKIPSFVDQLRCASNWVESQIYESLNRLKIDRLHAVLIHNTRDLCGVNGIKIIEALENLKNNNIIEKLGVSVYGPDELDFVTKLMHLDLVQAPYNLIDRSLETSGWLDSLYRNGVSVHTRSTFLQGLLLMDIDEIPNKFRKWGNVWQNLREHLEILGISAPDACLGFVLSKPQIDKVIIGVQNEAQLNQLIISSDIEVFESLENLICYDQDLINPSNWKML